MPRLLSARTLAVCGLALAAFLYWKPAHSYLRTKHELQTREAQVQALKVERTRLQRNIDDAATGPALVREARRLGLVKPGERLFIVRGISAWRHHGHAKR